MRRFLETLFSDSPRVSMMRVMSFSCCLSAVGIAVYGISRQPTDYSGLSMLCGVFLGAAFGGKVAQKSIESKSDKG